MASENLGDFCGFVRKKIRKYFEAAQHQYGHQKLIEKCRELHNKCTKHGDENEDVFLNEFTNALKYVLVYSEKSAVDNIISFASKYVTLHHASKSDVKQLEEDVTIDEFPSFLSGVLRFIFKTHGAALIDARLRCMQLLCRILSGMPESSLISDEIWKELKETVLCRLQDKNFAVRAQTVLTARMLQEPKNPNCEIIKALIFHFNDMSPAVRRAVVSSIALNKVTIGHVLARTRDVNDNVRRNTYLVFSKIKMLNLTIKYRVTILERGLQDRAEVVRKCVEQIVIINWLENFDNNIVQFLEALDVVNCSEIAMNSIGAILRTKPIDEVLKQLPIEEETKLIPEEKMTPETVLFWRSLADYFFKTEKDEELESILPDLTIFCDHVRKFYKFEEINSNADSNLNEEEQWTAVKNKEILMHLLEIFKFYDLSDEMGRCKLKELIIDLLISPKIQNDQIKPLTELMASVVPEKDSFIRELTEVISEIRQPIRTVCTAISKRDQMERDLKMSDLRIALNELREKEYEEVGNKNYEEAQRLKEEIQTVEAELRKLEELPTTLTQEVAEEKNDPVTLCKCLTILVETVKCSRVKVLTPTLINLKENFLSHCVVSTDLLTQSLVIQASAQFCILDRETAKQNVIRFLLMISEDGDNEINIPSLKAVFDIIQTHGMECFDHLIGDDDKENNEGNAMDRDGDSRSESENSENGCPKSISRDDLSKSFEGINCLKILNALLYCKTNDALMAVAYEGMCKLLLSGIIQSTSILTRIIVKGFSPIVDCESEDFIRQTFILFFPIFAAKIPGSQEMIEASFIPTLKAIDGAALESPEAEIDLKNVIAFLVEYTKADVNKFSSKTLHVHNNLALTICHEIYRDLIDSDGESSYLTQFYVKSLNMLEISVDSESFLRQLLTLIGKIEKKWRDSTYLKSLLNFKKKVNEKIKFASISSVENTLLTDRDSNSKVEISLARTIDSSASTTGNSNQKSQKELVVACETASSEIEDSSSPSKTFEIDPVVVPESPDVFDST